MVKSKFFQNGGVYPYYRAKSIIRKYSIYSVPATAHPVQTLSQLESPPGNNGQGKGHTVALSLCPACSLHLLIRFCILGWLNWNLQWRHLLSLPTNSKPLWNTLASKMGLVPKGTGTDSYQEARFWKKSGKGVRTEWETKDGSMEAKDPLAWDCEVTVGNFEGQCQWNFSYMLHSQVLWKNSRPSRR